MLPHARHVLSNNEEQYMLKLMLGMYSARHVLSNNEEQYMLKLMLCTNPTDISGEEALPWSSFSSLRRGGPMEIQRYFFSSGAPLAEPEEVFSRSWTSSLLGS